MMKDSKKRAKPRSRNMLLVEGSSFVREKLQGKVFLVPSCITVVGTFCGFLALMSAVKGQFELTIHHVEEAARYFEYATKCIALAIIIDGLDGRVARRLNATTAFGREFDSLSDLVAFGVAPAVLLYCWGFSAFADEFGILVGFIFVVCSATRLARFNVTTTDEPKGHFTGLPTPGAAAAVAAVVYSHPEPLTNSLFSLAMLIYTPLIAVFMVSTMPFFSVKKIKLTPDNQRLYLIILAALVALTWKYSRLVIIVGSTLYALSGPAMYLLDRNKKKRKGSDDTTLGTQQL